LALSGHANDGKVVTELSPAGDFWEAEPEHQDYLERYPNGYTCHFVRPQWKLRQQFLSSCSNSCQALVCLVGDDV
jgi:peptide methionine sulfoxide reductase MsrA